MKINNEYFIFMTGINKLSFLLNSALKDYLIDKRIPCNTTQIGILHAIIELGRGSSYKEIGEYMSNTYKNNHYNFSLLTENGYLFRRNFVNDGYKSNYTFFDITDKGKELYKELCDYTSLIMKDMKKEIGWEDPNFSDWLDTLTEIQDFFIEK